jgi:2-methylcitrate dehydratase
VRSDDERAVQVDTVATGLVDFASKLDMEDISKSAIHAAKRSVIDSFGCALGAFHLEPMRGLRSLAAETSSRTPATVLGTTISTSPELAALANGSMIRYLDFSDDYFGGTGSLGPHPSDNIAAVLAASEAERASGRTFLLGVVLAYEVVGQIVDNIVITGKRTWDYPTLHAMATSLAAGRILQLSRDQLLNALGLATVANISLNQTRQGEISDWKGLAGPNGSRNGLFAASLARHGITGPQEPVEGPAGLIAHLGVELELDEFGGNGRSFRIENTYFKWLPVRYHCQLPVWAAIDLRNELGEDRLAKLERITTFLAGRYVTDRQRSPDDWNPRTPGSADHSFAYLMAAALIDGEITQHTFSHERFRDPEVLELTQRIELQEDPQFTADFPETFNVRLDVELSTGERLSINKTNPKGHPANPLTDEEIGQKFLDQAEPGLTAGRAEELLHQLWRLEELESISEIFPLTVVSREVGR